MFLYQQIVQGKTSLQQDFIITSQTQASQWRGWKIEHKLIKLWSKNGLYIYFDAKEEEIDSEWITLIWRADGVHNYFYFGQAVTEYRSVMEKNAMYHCN